MKEMMRKIVVLMAAVMLFVGPMKAQIFIADDEFEGTLRLEEDEFVLFVPNQGHDGDQFAPIGEGMLALTVLGGAYLLTKRKKKE